MKKLPSIIILSLVAAFALCLFGCSKPVYEFLDGSIMNDKIGNDEQGTYIEGEMKSNRDEEDRFYVIYNLYDKNDTIIGEACAMVLCDKGATANFKAYVDSKTINFLEEPVGMSNFAQFIGTSKAMFGSYRTIEADHYKAIDVISSTMVQTWSTAKAAELNLELRNMK